MKIATWNINSIRARGERMLAWLKEHQPDVLCLQELKCTDEQFPMLDVQAAGYRAEVFGQKTYNGVAIVSKHAITDVTRGLNDGVEDDHARLIAGTVQGIRIYSLYAPNGQEVGSPAYQYKLQWYDRLGALLKAKHQPTDSVVLCGDFNVAPQDIDVWNVPLFAGQTLFTEPEKAALKRLAESLALTDVYRKVHPEPGKYSWWDYRMLGFPKNHGLRIDHHWVTASVAARVNAAEIDREARKGKLPSDHAPVWVQLSEAT
ncbi:MAG: exodeoxyribonuclease III [Myxococcaceae bacterium]|nr:exodeoxyribonuclease III [Myxococcaceae bacterium]